MSDLRAAFSDLAVEMEKHSNIHDKDGSTSMCAAVEGVCADRINAILKHAPDLAALEAQFHEKALSMANDAKKYSLLSDDAEAVLALAGRLAAHLTDKGATMQSHQERVVAEKSELDDKLSKLRLFFGGKIFGTLGEEEQDRLQRQEKAMSEYSEILAERINAFV